MTEPLPAHLLLRISEDPHDKRTGVTRQRKLGHDLADRLGWVVADRVYEDNNRSAWKRDVVRDDYEALLADIKAGVVRAVIVFDRDRISRRDWQVMYFRDLCRKHRVRVAIHTKGGEVDLESPWEWAMDGVRAQEESETKSKRIKVTKDEHAMDGKPSGQVLYGWRRVVQYDDRGRKVAWHDELNAETAGVVAEAARRVLAGEKLCRIADDFNARAIPTPKAHTKKGAKRWEVTTIRALLLRPANVRQRVHRGEVMVGVVGDWPALLPDATYIKVVALLRDPKRKTVDDNRVRHLLTGIGTTPCGGHLRRKAYPPKPAKYRRTEQVAYVCATDFCVSMDLAAVDTLVTWHVLDYLERVPPAELLADEGNDVTAAAAQASALEARLATLSDLVADGSMSPDEYRRQQARLRPQLDAARQSATVQASPGRDLAYSLAGDGVRERWARLAIEQQRAIVAVLFDVVLLARTDKSRRGSDPQRVQVQLRR